MIQIRRVVAFVRDNPWAILPEKLEQIVELVEDHASGVRYSVEDVQARIGAPARRETQMMGTIAVLPLYGVIAPRANVMNQISGGTSIEQFRETFNSFIENRDVDGLVLDIDSPGGSVIGVQEMAAEIRAARGTKPIIAVANNMAASAAYALASQATEVWGTPSSMTGAIGVYMVHSDMSRALEMRGITETVISAGKYKAEGMGPLSDEAREAIQRRVDAFYAAFVNDVARGRRTSPDAVREGYGQGRALTSNDAMQAGLIDHIGTLGQAVAYLQRAPASRSARANHQPVEVATEEPVAETNPSRIESLSKWLEQFGNHGRHVPATR